MDLASPGAAPVPAVAVRVVAISARVRPGAHPLEGGGLLWFAPRIAAGDHMAEADAGGAAEIPHRHDLRRSGDRNVPALHRGLQPSLVEPGGLHDARDGVARLTAPGCPSRGAGPPP